MSAIKSTDFRFPKRILLIRHAQSEANENPLIYSEKPDHLHELTSLGERQSQEAGNRLHSLFGNESYGVFVSPYLRTMRTMEIACGSIGRDPVFIHEDPRLREQDHGPMRSPDTSAEHRNERNLHGMFFYRFPSGESCADIFDRVSTFLETLHRRFAAQNFPENILMFTHGTAMKCFLMRWYHWSYRTFETLPAHPPNGHIVLMLREDNSPDFGLSEPFDGPFLQPITDTPEP